MPLTAGRTATLREVYYSFKGSDCAFKNQAEADGASNVHSGLKMYLKPHTMSGLHDRAALVETEAVLNAASLLGVARHELGIFASAKGASC